VIIDAWMQHPSAEFLKDPMFGSLPKRTLKIRSDFLPYQVENPNGSWNEILGRPGS